MIDNKDSVKYNLVMKYAALAVMVVILVIFNIVRVRELPQYKILKVRNCDEFYIDFNNNGKIDDNELVKIYGINGFHAKANRSLKYQIRSSWLTKNEILALGVLAKEFSEREFTGKTVQLIYKEVELHQNRKYKAANIYLTKDGKPDRNIAEILLNEGFATPTHRVRKYRKELSIVNMEKHLAEVKKQNIYILNRKKNTYHSLYCKYASRIKQAEAFRKENLPKNATPCRLCVLGLKKFDKYAKFPDENFVFKNFDFTEGNMSFYFMDFNRRMKPDSTCSVASCKILLSQIDNAKESIDFAVYGFSGQPKIIQALVSAQKRGVKIRWVTDEDRKGNNIYNDVKLVQKLLPDYKTDNHLIPRGCGSNAKYTNAIMHDKFFIFDKKSVWVGSANISSTDLADFNANIVIFANSKSLAEVYGQEFEQMYREKFHFLKEKILNKENLRIDGRNTVSVYFSPQDNVISSQIVPMINNARKYVYISSFVVTHENVLNALLKAEERGVDVKLLIDATSANSKFSVHNKLRAGGVSVKVENKAGKMHTKSLVVDDRYILTGSMNLTHSGTSINDENLMLINNSNAAKIFKAQFLYLYNSVPNIWLVKTPHAEGPSSPGSCFDGIDNDFDGLIDKADPGCKFAKR